MTADESTHGTIWYEAARSRDARFDGVFFLGVRTTGVYCRPSCPARTPLQRNVRYFRTAAAAQRAGFRACRRCRPDAAPGSAEWDVRADLVGRATRMIGDGVVDREGVAGLAHRLGYSARQVHRRLTEELGAGPAALARAQRAHTARLLLTQTSLAVTDVAFAAGFASVRQFNDTMRQVYDRAPGELRGAAGRKGRPVRGRATGGAAEPGAVRAGYTGVPLRLAYRGPYARGELFGFLQRRAVTGVEEVTGGAGARTYRRTLRLPCGIGIIEVDEHNASGTPVAARDGADGGWLDCRLHLTDLRDLTTAVHRVRRLFDLDADPCAVAEHLGADDALRPLVERHPGLRSPGAADPEELAVRAVLGQQISVAAARTLTARLADAYGEPLPTPDGSLTRLFPEAAVLAGAALGELGMPERRRATIRTVAAAVAGGRVALDAGADRDEAERELLALPGVGPWTAGYVRMRALGDPDVFLSGDVGVRHGLEASGAEADRAAAWRPWRSYALHHLWQRAAEGGG